MQNLDAYLETVPDEPKGDGWIPGAVDPNGRPSNSIIAWCMNRHDDVSWKIPAKDISVTQEKDDIECFCEMCC